MQDVYAYCALAVLFLCALSLVGDGVRNSSSSSDWTYQQLILAVVSLWKTSFNKRQRRYSTMTSISPGALLQNDQSYSRGSIDGVCSWFWCLNWCSISAADLSGCCPFHFRSPVASASLYPSWWSTWNIVSMQRPARRSSRRNSLCRNRILPLPSCSRSLRKLISPGFLMSWRCVELPYWIDKCNSDSLFASRLTPVLFITPSWRRLWYPRCAYVLVLLNGYIFIFFINNYSWYFSSTYKNYLRYCLTDYPSFCCRFVYDD